MAKKMRLDRLMLERGFSKDEKTVRAWIMEGRVLVGDVREDKPGTLVAADAPIRLRGVDIPYAGRGGLKLAAAIDRFQVDVLGRVAIDVGASTGGFTDCLLSRGASRVYAVDVGFGQLVGRLRQDPRVVNMERTNIGDVTPDVLVPRPDLGVIDLSYLSLSIAVPTVAGLLAPAQLDGPGSEIVALVKPLFEVKAKGPDLEETDYRAAVRQAAEAGRGSGYSLAGVMASPVLGSGGTLEFFVHLGTRQGITDPDREIDRAIQEGLTILARGMQRDAQEDGRTGDERSGV
ncbi:MAG: TlyA family RNA methyltransferase [Firmicutes bacterium]|nr:TlyA family RNA methyltransferase [Bacillota bacterium]